MNALITWLFVNVLPIILLLIGGIWLVIKSKEFVRYKKAGKILGMTLLALGVLFIIFNILIFSIVNDPTINLEIEVNSPLASSLEYEDITIIIDGRGGGQSPIANIGYLDGYTVEHTIDCYYVENNVKLPFNFIDNNNQTQITVTRIDTDIEIEFISPLTSDIYGTIILLNETNEQNTVILEGDDGSITIEFSYFAYD